MKQTSPPRRTSSAASRRSGGSTATPRSCPAFQKRRIAADYDGLPAHVRRTVEAGLTPAVNMDTGYTNLLTDEERGRSSKSPGCGGSWKRLHCWSVHRRESGRSRRSLQGGDRASALLRRQRYHLSVLRHEGLERNGTRRPLQAGGGGERPLYAFELGEMFAPFGRIWSDAVPAGSWKFRRLSAISTPPSTGKRSGKG